MSDADDVSCMNRTSVPVIGNESVRTQLSELSRPQHHPNGHRQCVRCALPARGAYNINHW